jgi:hypothetical protein
VKDIVSGTRRHEVWYMLTDISEEAAASIFSVEEMGKV